MFLKFLLEPKRSKTNSYHKVGRKKGVHTRSCKYILSTMGVAFWERLGLANFRDDTKWPWKNLHSTYILISDKKQLIGTVAILGDDLLSHSHLNPWLTCLYVVPMHRGKGYGRRLMEHAIKQTQIDRLYLWCYEQSMLTWYVKYGWKLHETITYQRKPAFILTYTSL